MRGVGRSLWGFLRLHRSSHDVGLPIRECSYQSEADEVVGCRYGAFTSEAAVTL